MWHLVEEGSYNPRIIPGLVEAVKPDENGKLPHRNEDAP